MIQPDTIYQNIHVKTIYSDEHVSSFVIWIKKEVKLHKHVYHSEQVYIIEGKGVMTLGIQKFPVEKGDWIMIPKGMPHSVKVTSSKPLKVLSVQSPEFKGDDRIFLEEKE
jgi:mannose-6-phosphate isomerase-like protein (cupin superfamily)